jgi:hypothetical protein
MKAMEMAKKRNPNHSNSGPAIVVVAGSLRLPRFFLVFRRSLPVFFSFSLSHFFRFLFFPHVLNNFFKKNASSGTELILNPKP